jgi:uncharacterized protein
VDSAFLARVAHEVLGDRALAVIADSPSLPRRELAEALALGERCGFAVRVIQTHEFEDTNYTSNPNNRCYFCKKELFLTLARLAQAERFAVMAYGENASDVGDYRPGAQAAGEFRVRAPLKEVGLTKAEIRELSAQMGLPTADKPQMACLSSRVPHGEPVTPQKLSMIERAENVLRDLGFKDVRVRHHELRVSSSTSLANKQPMTEPETKEYLARIEVGPTELKRFADEDLTLQVTETLRHVGYAYVTLDLQGYRRGSLNPSLRGGGKN